MEAPLCRRMLKLKDFGKETSKPWPLQLHHNEMSGMREEKFPTSHPEGSNHVGMSLMIVGNNAHKKQCCSLLCSVIDTVRLSFTIYFE